MEKVKNFQRNYLESEKFFSKFSYFLEGKMKISGIFLESENFQNLKMIDLNLKVKIFKKKISTKLLKVKNIPKPKSENFQDVVFKKVSENKK